MSFQPGLDVRRRKERMTNYFTNQQQQDFNKPENPLIILNPNRAPNSAESPLIDQVKNYFSNRVNTLEFAQIFEGNESKSHMLNTFIYSTTLLALFFILPFYLDYIGTKFCLIVILLNGFHILGLYLFYFSKNSDYALGYLTVIIFSEFGLFYLLWGGGLQNNMFSIFYVLFNGSRFVRQLPISPPSIHQKLQTFPEFFTHALFKSLKPTTIAKRLAKFLIFLIPIQGMLLLINQIYVENNLTIRKLLLACFIDLVFQFSDSILTTCKKYYIFKLSPKVDLLPLFIYPLCLQNNQQQEIASINFINSLRNDETIFDQKMLFRLDGCQPPTIRDVLQSYYYEKLKNYVSDVSAKFMYLTKLSNEIRKGRNIYEDITFPYTIVKNLYLVFRTKQQLKQIVKFYYFVFKSFDQFQRENLYEQECVRFNAQLIQIIDNQNLVEQGGDDSEEKKVDYIRFDDPKVLAICKRLAKMSEKHLKHEIFKTLLQ